MKNADRLLAQMLPDIAQEHHIDCIPLAEHWVFRLQKQARTCFVYGYHFDINAAAASLLVQDKYAAAQALLQAGLPVVPHQRFVRPDLAALLEMSANWRAMLECFSTYRQDVICKANLGSGGQNVFRARSLEELEYAVHQVFRGSRSLCLSPYLEIQQEYRVVMHGSDTLLVYRKQRPEVTGDGQSALYALIIEQLGPEVQPDLALDLHAVPARGEKILVNWRHNLGLGSRAERVSDPALQAQLSALARQALHFLGLQLASVDMVLTSAGLQILEVNAGIMLERFGLQGPAEYEQVRQIYTRLVLHQLACEDTPQPLVYSP